VVLGWEIDTVQNTLHLQPHKAQRLHDLIATFLPLTRTSRRKWQQLLGEFRYMATALQGACYLFSVLQHVLLDHPTLSRVRLTPLVKQTLQDWQTLTVSLASKPMPIASLVPWAPHFLGAIDASGQGCGGVWIPSQHGRLEAPTVFRFPFPETTKANLVSSTNKSGTITNSDLELAAIALGAAQSTHTPHLRISRI
jgi:hypothetical protein